MFDFIFKNKEIFFYFVDECNKKYRSGHDLSSYRNIIKKHKDHNNLGSLLKDEGIYPLIIKTLKAWNMDQRRAKLTTVENFKQSFFFNHVKEDLVKLSNYKLHLINNRQIESEIIGLLENVFLNLKVMESKKRIVGVSKALHFLLPDLIMPIDNKYTINFFNVSTDLKRELSTFKNIFIKMFEIAKCLCLTQNDVDGKKWNTSVPKLIDNAIIGFNRYFKDCVMQFSDSAVDRIISLIEKFTSLESSEKEKCKRLLEKQKNKLLKTEREKIREKLLIEKARKVGITVSKEEIEAYLSKKMN